MVRENEQEGRRSIDVDALIDSIRLEIGAGRPALGDAAPNGEELLARVRAEVTRRKHQADMSSDPEAAHVLEWGPAQPRMPSQREYALGDLTRFDDEDFVTNAYLAVLRRPPDQAGLAGALHALRQGKSKVEVLGTMRWSPEGVSRSVHIDGLLLPYTLQRWEQKRFIGRPIAWLHGLMQLGVAGRRQRIAEARQARETHELGHLFNRLAIAEAKARDGKSRELKQFALVVKREQDRVVGRVDSVKDALEHDLQRLSDTVEQKVDEVRSGVERKISDVGGGLQRQIDDAKGEAQQKIGEVRSEIEQYIHRIRSEISQELRQVEQQIVAAKDALATVRSAVDVAESRLVQLNELEDDWRNQAAETRISDEFVRSLDPLYADFEDAFRGSRELIRRRVEPYLDWVQEGGKIDADAPILDIGCGRGEWLEVARDHGLQAKGIDINRAFAESCRVIGLDVVEGDAIGVLKTMSDGSMGAITSMHLVEHLPYNDLIRLLDEAYRVLRPGGVIALETPNPENLSVSSHWFFLDPTHRNPLPPVTLAWLVRHRGFVDPRIERLTADRDVDAPPLLSPDLPGATTINVVLERLHAATDYSIVARKPYA